MGLVKLENGPNVVLTSVIGGHLHLSSLNLDFAILLVSFTLSHFKESSPTFLQVVKPLS